jgi:hypothetical protein
VATSVAFVAGTVRAEMTAGAASGTEVVMSPPAATALKVLETVNGGPDGSGSAVAVSVYVPVEVGV